MRIKNDISEHEKIRDYLLNMIYHADSAEQALPSSRNLAERFGVARTTVTNVVNELALEGYLEIKHGKGVYLNRRNMFHAIGVKPFPIIGFIIGNGNNFYHDWSSWSPMALTGVYLEDRAFHLHEFKLQSPSIALTASLLKESHNDGIVWFNPPNEVEPLARELFESGLPVATVFNNFDAVPGVDMAPEADGVRLGRLLTAEKRRSLFFALNDSSYSEGVLNGLRKAYGESGYKLNERLIFRDKSKFRDDLHAALEFGAVPDAFFINGSLTSTIMEMLQERGIDIKERCRLIADSHAMEIPGFHGIVKRPPFEEIGRKCSDMICRMVRGKDMHVEHAIFNFSMKFEGEEI